MQKYNQTSVTGDSWTRAKRIVIENILDSENIIKFVEEKVVNLDGSEVNKDLGVLETKVGDAEMGNVIDIIDPTTGEPTGGTITYGELHAMIFSVYLKLAAERDAPETVEEPTEDPDGTTSDGTTA